jgi:O-antigen ligase
MDYSSLQQSVIMNRFTLFERQSRHLIKWFTIPLVLIASGILSYEAPKIIQGDRRFLIILIVVIGGVLALILFKYPQIGLVILPISGLAIPISLGTGTQSGLNASILTVAALGSLWLLNKGVKEHRFMLALSRSNLPLVGLIVAAVLAFINGQLPWFGGVTKAPLTAQVGGFALFIFSALAFLLTADQLKDQIWLQRITWTFLVSSALYVTGRIIPQLGSFVNRFVSNGAIGSLFWVWLVSLAFSQGFLNKELKGIYRVLLVGMVIGTFYVALTQGKSWTSGWLPPLISLVVVLILAKPKWISAYLAITGVLVIYKYQQLLAFIMVGDNQYSLMTRQQAWGILGEMVKASPLFGLGPANYHFYTPLFPILGYSVQFNSHNQYIDLLAQVGFLGLACFLWFAWELGREGLRLLPRVPAGFPKAYLVGALGGLVGTLAAGMLGDWIIPFVYNIGFEGFRASILAWIFLGGMVALQQMTLRNSSTS